MYNSKQKQDKKKRCFSLERFVRKIAWPKNISLFC